MGLPGKALLTWLVLLVAMFANGTLRVLVLQPRLGEDRARQLACVSGVCIVVAVSRAFVRRLVGVAPAKLVWVGVTWVVLTLAFEFLFGHFVSGISWAGLLADYNVFQGRLWVFVLLAVLVSPWAWAALGHTTKS